MCSIPIVYIFRAIYVPFVCLLYVSPMYIFVHRYIKLADAKTLEGIAHPEYWDARYSRAAESSYDWFGSYSTPQPFFERHMPPAAPSSDPESTAKPLLLHLVIGKMAARFQETDDLDWRIMDVRDMLGIATASIDVAIDKGTLDAMIYGSLWDPPEEVRGDTERYIDEVVRVRRMGGLFLYITYRQPHIVGGDVGADGVGGADGGAEGGRELLILWACG